MRILSILLVCLVPINLFANDGLFDKAEEKIIILQSNISKLNDVLARHSQELENITPNFVTPEIFGAVGNDDKDDTEALKKCIHATSKAGGGYSVYIPGKEYHLSETLEIGTWHASKIFGNGLGAFVGSIRHPQNAGTSRITWIGKTGGTILEYRGSGLIWSGVMLDGGNRAEKGILITKRNEGIGVGKAHFSSFAILRCNIGIQCGRSWSEHNNDCLLLTQLIFDDCRVGYKIVNHQSMSHHFYYPTFRHVDTCLEWAAGGDIHFRGGLNLYAKRFVHMPVPEEGTYGVGANQCLLSIHSMKFDSQCPNTKWIQMDTPSCIRITLDNCQVGVRYKAEKVFELYGRTALTIKNCFGMIENNSFVLKHNPRRKNRAPNVMIWRTQVPKNVNVNDLIHPDSTGYNQVKLQDCFDWEAIPVKDIVLQ